MKLNQIVVATIMVLGAFNTQAKNIDSNVSLEQKFATVKSDVSKTIGEDLKEIEQKWDEMIKKIEDCLAISKETKVKERALKQHRMVAEELRKKLKKQVTGHTSKEVNNYKSISEKADDKTESKRKQSEKSINNLHKQLTQVMNIVKQGQKDALSAHDTVQKALIKEDKENQEKKTIKAKKNK